MKLAQRTYPCFVGGSNHTQGIILTYGFEFILPPNIFLPSLQLSQYSQEYPIDSMQRRIDTLLRLEEERERVKGKFDQYQQRIKSWFDQKKVGGEEV